MFSTVLFIQEAPVGYQVKKSGSTLLFTPSPFSLRANDSPQFSLSQVDGLWHIEGMVDMGVRQQVYEEVERFRAAGLLE